MARAAVLSASLPTSYIWIKSTRPEWSNRAMAKTSVLSKILCTAANRLTPLEEAPPAFPSNSRWGRPGVASGWTVPEVSCLCSGLICSTAFAHQQSRPGLHQGGEMACQPAGPVSTMDMKQSWVRLQSRGRPSKTEKSKVSWPGSQHRSSCKKSGLIVVFSMSHYHPN